MADEGEGDAATFDGKGLKYKRYWNGLLGV